MTGVMDSGIRTFPTERTGVDMPQIVASSTISQEEMALHDLDDARLEQMRDHWRDQVVMPNRFPGSTNSLFVKKARMLTALDEEMRRRGIEAPAPEKG